MEDFSWQYEVTEKDIDAIRALVKEVGVFSAEEIEVAVELAQDRLMRSTASDYYFILAYDQNTLAGYSCFGRIPFTDGRYDLYWIVVGKNWQRQGLARKLNQQTETNIKKLDGKILYAETSSRTPYISAYQFYNKNGYEELARLKDFYSDGDDKIIFGKPI
jgi:ribosomal protein S18 acetylase RimI-like enzyme